MAEKEQFQRGRQKEIMAYFWNNPGRTIGIDELVKQFPQYTRDKIMNTMAYVCDAKMRERFQHFKAIDKLSTGAWRLAGPDQPESVQSKSEPEQKANNFETLTVTIIKEYEDELVVVDERATIYRMRVID